jgi:hypothetical protein
MLPVVGLINKSEGKVQQSICTSFKVYAMIQDNRPLKFCTLGPGLDFDCPILCSPVGNLSTL